MNDDRPGCAPAGAQRTFRRRAAGIVGSFSIGRAALFHARSRPLLVRALIRNQHRARCATGSIDVGFCRWCGGLAIANDVAVLGAIADASGRRKPWIAVRANSCGGLLALLWIGKPGDPAIIPPALTQSRSPRRCRS